MRVLTPIILLFLAAASNATADDALADAQQVVERFHAELSTLARADGAGEFDTRYERLAPVVDDTHDLAFIARLAIGRTWNTLPDATRAAYLERFRRLSIATYAGRFTGGMPDIVVTKAEAAPRGRVVVYALLKTDERDIEFGYHLHRVDDAEWRIANILVDGVSDLALKRAEYARIVRDEGVDALLDALAAQADDLAENS